MKSFLGVISDSTEVDGTLNVVSGVEWKDDLKDKSSTYFKIVSSEIAIEVQYIIAVLSSMNGRLTKSHT